MRNNLIAHGQLNSKSVFYGQLNSARDNLIPCIRLDTENCYIIVPGHSEEELRPILATFEDLYRDQLPDLQLHRWTKPIFTWLTNPILDPDSV